MRLPKRSFPFIVAALLVVAGALFLLPGRHFVVDRSSVLSRLTSGTPREENTSAARNPFTGIACATENVPRPIAVMLSGDAVTRPLSGIGKADLVVEMPVIIDGINRFMAVYACPKSDDVEIGSIRSARDDYIPLAAAFDAIYSHWGGSHFALDELARHVIDDLDALKNPYGAYFRKAGIGAPHNGFTTLSRLRSAAEKLGYRTTLRDGFLGYPHGDATTSGVDTSVIGIGYPGTYRVEWRYEKDGAKYLRWRGGTLEQERATGAQVYANTIVVMRTKVRQVEGQYNDVRVTGFGEATVYRSGSAITGRWQKDDTPLDAPLRFLDADGGEIPFAQGPVWIEIVQTDTQVTASFGT